jgi:hypothetical protein
MLVNAYVRTEYGIRSTSSFHTQTSLSITSIPAPTIIWQVDLFTFTLLQRLRCLSVLGTATASILGVEIHSLNFQFIPPGLLWIIERTTTIGPVSKT